MDELIKTAGGWEFVKTVGGLSVIISAVTTFIATIVINKLSQSSQHRYNSDIEKMKSDMDRNNGVLNSLLENYFQASQRTVDRKIDAYDKLWTGILAIKGSFPTGISMALQLVKDSEIEQGIAFKMIEKSKLGVEIRKYNMDVEMEKLVANGGKLDFYKPYISDGSYKIFHTFQGLVGRVTYGFLDSYEKGEVYNWKKDEHLRGILAVCINNEEFAFLFGLKVASLSALMDLLEYKVLRDFRTNVNIKGSEMDTIKYIKDLETLYKSARIGGLRL